MGDDSDDEEDAQYEGAVTEDEGKEHAALKALHMCGIVLEHIETRMIEVKDQPGMDQGKLECWVDIFPTNPEIGTLPMPVDVAPRKPTHYELRVVIWDTEDVVLNSKSLITGDAMTDVYVTARIPGMEHMAQKTDVHYRSLDGTANFNWRMVFPIDWLPVEQMIEFKKKAHFFKLDAEAYRVPPVLRLEIWDNSIFGKGDYLGSVDIDLMKIEPPPKRPKRCKLHRNIPPNKLQNLFLAKSVSGWFPCTSGTLTEDSEITGKIDVQIDLVGVEEIAEKPVGKARDEPNNHPHLDFPNRPKTSLGFLLNPFASFRLLIWTRFKWYILALLLIGLLVLFLYLFFTYLPPVILMKSFGIGS